MTHKLITEISSNNGKLFKEGIIHREALASNKEFFAGLRYALDNIDTFGVKQIPIRSGADGTGLSFLKFSDLANNLIARELTGGAALEAIDKAMRLATNDEWNGWYRRILLKDLGAGFSESTVNKAVKGVNESYTVPVTPYMRCSLPEGSNMEDWDWSKGVYSQIKADGQFAYVNVSKDGFVQITSRGGTVMPQGALGIEEAASTTFRHGTSNHGELTVYRNGVMLERQIGNGILNSIQQGEPLQPNLKVVFDCWDQIPLSEFVPKGKYAVPYKARFDTLEKQVMTPILNGTNVIQIQLIETRIVYSPEEALAHYRDARKRKLEGTVCKSADAQWKDGTSKDQVKQKEVIDVELRVKGFTPGKNKFAHLFGSITCESECGLLEVNASGIPDDLRVAIHNDRAGWMDAIVTIRSNGIMYSTKAGKKHSLFLPRFIERRDDKTVADTLAQIEAQFAAAIK
jgi:DNA ligase-1